MNWLVYIIFIISIVFSKGPTSYSLPRIDDTIKFDNKYRVPICGWPSLSIIDLRQGPNNSIYAGTGGGLGYILPGSEANNIYFSDNNTNLPIGGNPSIKSLEVDGDWITVLSGVETVTYFGDDVASGTGVSWSFGDDVWYHISQPQDTVSNGYIDYDWYGNNAPHRAVNTNAKNVSYDLSVDYNQKYIYAASWAGMLRRFKYTDEVPEWEIVPLPMDNQDSLICGEITQNYYYDPVDPPFGHHNHKGFSVHVEDDIIWAGTANGVNKGIIQENGCINWYHYTIDDGLAGDWIVGFETQDIGSDYPRIWAISWLTSGGPSPHGLSYTDNQGETWQQVNYFATDSSDPNDVDAIVYDMYFYNQEIYVSTDEGLFIAPFNDIQDWTKIEIPIDLLTQLNTEKIYSSIVNVNIQKMWFGTPEGFITFDINSNQWDVPSLDAIDCPDQKQNKLIAYPNPYYTDDTGNITFRIKTNLEYGKIDVFDFSMSKVVSLDCYKEGEFLMAGWNGKNSNNYLVANGTYFGRLKSGAQEFWTKITVINIK